MGVDRTRSLLGVDAVTLFLASDDGSTLKVVATADRGNVEIERLRVPVDPSIQAAGDGGARLLSDVSRTSGGHGSQTRGRVPSLLAVPLVAGERVLGVLDIGSHDERTLGEDEERLLRLAASVLTLAVDRAHGIQAFQNGQQELASLSRRLIDLHESERRSLARELHDELGQILAAVKHVLARELDPNSVAQSLVDGLLARVSKLASTLRPPMLDDLGLLATLLSHIERFSTETGVRTRFEHSGLERRFPPDVEIAAFRIIQEGLTNIARHSGAPEATVIVAGDREQLRITIEDGGVGFDPALAIRTDSNGLAGMRDRVRLLGGKLEFDTRPGAGTRIKAELPTVSKPGTRGPA